MPRTALLLLLMAGCTPAKSVRIDASYRGLVPCVAVSLKVQVER